MQVSSNACEFRKVERKLVYVPRVGHFPEVVVVVSSATGKAVTFVQDAEAALRNEFWDGMECHYIPTAPQERVDSLVLLAE